jgi:hypothetical protein
LAKFVHGAPAITSQNSFTLVLKLCEPSGYWSRDKSKLARRKPQRPYLGFTGQPAFFSALVISTSVPLSVFSDSIFQQESFYRPEFFIALFYCLIIWLAHHQLAD